MFWNAYKRILTLGADNITLRINNPSTESAYTFYYKIVLMKLPTYIEGEDYTLGDVNEDGEINETDLKIIEDYIMGDKILSDNQFKSSDMNKDGEINSIDYVRLMNQISLQYQLGDINIDGTVDQADKNLLQQYLQGEATLDVVQKILADINRDNTLDSANLLLFQKYLNGEIT